MYSVFIIYCVFSKILKYLYSDLCPFLVFPRCQSVYIGLHAWAARWQIEHQCYKRTGRVKKIHNILRKITQHLMNTLYIFLSSIFLMVCRMVDQSVAWLVGRLVIISITGEQFHTSECIFLNTI